MQTIIIGIGSYLGGLFTGYFISRIWKPVDDKNKGDFVLLAVTMIWAFSMIVDIISPQYETSPLVHGLMGAIVGFFYKPQNKTP